MIGWFIGAMYVQNRAEKTESPGAGEEVEPCPDCDGLRLPAVARGVEAH